MKISTLLNAPSPRGVSHGGHARSPRLRPRVLHGPGRATVAVGIATTAATCLMPVSAVRVSAATAPRGGATAHHAPKTKAPGHGKGHGPVNPPSPVSGIGGQTTPHIALPPNPITFSATTQTLPTAGSGGSQTAFDVGDLNNDGRDDIVVPSYSATGTDGLAYIQVYLAGGGGVFPTTQIPTYSVQVTGMTSATQVSIADFNHDGYKDVAVAGGLIVAVLLNSPGNPGHFSTAPTGTVTLTGYAIEGLVAANLDGDGRPDLAATLTTCGLNCPVAETIHGLGTGAIGSVGTAVSIGDGYDNGFALTAKDLNEDSVDDLAAGDQTCWAFRPNGGGLINDGAGNFTFTSLGTSAINWMADDVNGDRVPDLAFSCESSPGYWGVYVYPGTGAGAFSSTAITSGITETGSWNQSVMDDFNGDGTKDIVTLVGTTADYLLPMPGNGDGTFADGPQEYATGAVADSGKPIRKGDFDGDGKPDIVGMGSNNAPTNTLGVILNTTPTFGQALDGGALSRSEMAPGYNPAEEAACPACASRRHQRAQKLKADPINTATGDLSESFPGITLPGRGEALDFTEAYSTAYTGTDVGLGMGWTASYLMGGTVTNSGSTVTISQENGSQVTFTLNNSIFSAPPRVQATLVRSGTSPNYTYTYRRNGRDEFAFTAINTNTALQLTTIKDVLNNYTTTLAYSSGKLASVTEASINGGRSLNVTWSGSHITRVAEAGTGVQGRHADFTNDGITGDLTDIKLYDSPGTSGSLRQFHFGYDGSHRITSMQDPVNVGTANQVTVHYDGSNHVDWEKDQLNRQTSFSYATVNGELQVTTTDPRGRQTLETYNTQNELRQTIQGYGSSNAAEWDFAYDPESAGARLTTGPNGYRATIRYDLAGNEASSTDALQRTTTTVWNAFHEPMSVTDPLGVTTLLTYDTTGHLLQKQRPILSGTSITYETTGYRYGDPDHPGDVTGVVDPLGNVWSSAYDTYGNVVSTSDPLRNTATATYNANGWRLSATSPRGNAVGAVPSRYTTTFAYSGFGDLLSTTDPLHHTAARQYDADGRVTQATDADGHSTAYVYDVAGEQTQVLRADSPQTTLVTDYYADGTVQDQKDGLGSATTYNYDELGRPVSVTDPSTSGSSYGHPAHTQAGTCTPSPCPSTTYSYAYNSSTGLHTVSQVQADGGTTTSTFDAADQLQSIGYSDSTPGVTAIGYDLDGRRISMNEGTGGTGTSGWTYDTLGRLTSYTNGAGAAVSYAYNPRDLTSITYPGSGGSVTRTYDAAGRLTKVQDWLASPGPYSTTFGYDADSNLVTQTVPGSLTDTFSFDNADRLMGVSFAKTGTAWANFTYGRDPNGQVTNDAQTIPGSPLSGLGAATYSNLNQVSAAGSSSYQYDAADNPTRVGSSSATQTFDLANQLCWSGSSSFSCTGGTTGVTGTLFSFDARGNRTQSTPYSSGTAGTSSTYAYDLANRLTTETPAVGSAYAYAYNGDGLRQSRTTGGTTTQFAWDVSGGLPLLIKEGSSTYYIYGPGGLPIEEISGTTPYFFHHDQLGSTRALTDASGTVTTPAATYNYDASGKQTGSSGSFAASNALRWAGEYQDAETGFIYLRARYYDPATAQFLTRDPAVAATRSPYGYVAGNPLNSRDPLGLCGWTDLTGCFSDAASAVGSAAGTVAGAAGGAAGAVGNAIGQANHAVQDFEDTHVVGLCVNVSAGVGVGGTATGCVAGNYHSIGLVGTAGGGVDLPGAFDFSAGPMLSDAHSVHELDKDFDYAEASAGEGLSATAEVGGGQLACGRDVHYVYAGVGGGVQLPTPYAVGFGHSYTWSLATS